MGKDFCVCKTCVHFRACLGKDAEGRMFDIEAPNDCINYLRGNSDELLDILEKSTAKKPYHTEGEVAYQCPFCDHTVHVNLANMDMRHQYAFGLLSEFCTRCGQKLDWTYLEKCPDEEAKNEQ